MPYLYSQAMESIENGWPTSVRAVALEFPDDPTAWYVDREFMVGSQILAAPVFEEDGSSDFYLPPGTWYSFWDGVKFEGGRWQKKKYGFLETPLFVREGTILVLGQAEGEGGFAYNWLDGGGEVRLYGVKEGNKAVLVDHHGEEKGVIEIGPDGELKGMDILAGDWNVEKI